jgi:hypothetical protein
MSRVDVAIFAIGLAIIAALMFFDVIHPFGMIGYLLGTGIGFAIRKR